MAENNLLEISEREEELFNSFRDYYTKYVEPEPDKKDYRVKMGWEFFVGMLSAFSGVLLAALQTFNAYFVTATLEGGAYIRGLVATIAIEGNLVWYALRKSRKDYQDGDDVDTNGMVIGLVILILTSLLAGLHQSTTLITDGQGEWFINFIEWSLVVVMGIGATSIAWLGGDTGGRLIKRYEILLSEKNDDYDLDLSKWRINLLQAWESTEDYSQLEKTKKKAHLNERRKIDNDSSAGDEPRQVDDYNIAGKPSHWRTASRGKSKEWFIEIANLNDKGKKEKRARDEGVTPRTIDNWVGNAQRDLCWQYINKMKSFPTDDVFLAFGMGETDVAKFVSNNAKGLLDKKVVDAHMINRANELLKNG